MSKAKSRKSAPSDKSSKATKVAVEVIDWRPPLETKKINNLNWQAQVTCLIEFNSSHKPYLKAFNKAAESNLRLAIRTINADNLKLQVKKASADFKAQRSITQAADFLNDDITYYGNACDEAWKYWAKGIDNVPVELLAKVIKYEILRLKHEFIAIIFRQKKIEDAVKEELEAPVVVPVKCVIPCPNLVGSKKPLTGPPVATTVSNKLSRFGEEWRHTEYIDDAPKGGPQLYIVLSGFYNFDLIPELLKNDVPFRAIIQMRHEDDELDEYTELAKNKDRPKSKASSKGTGASVKLKPAEIEEAKYKNAIRNFWTSYSELMNDFTKYAKFENVAFLTFKTPTFNWDELEHIPEFESNLYDNLSNLMYDVYDLSRQHKHFIRNMKVIDVKESEPPYSLDEMVVYNGMLNIIPSECITVPVILESLLEQVVAILDPSKEQKHLPVIGTLSRHKTLSNQDKTCGKFKSKFVHIYKRIARDQQKTLFIARLEPTKITSDLEPIVITYGNEIRLKSWHVKKPIIENAVVDILLHHIVSTIWRQIPELVEEKRVEYLNHLRKLFEEHPNKKLSRQTFWLFLHLKVFEKMACASPIGTKYLLPIYKKLVRNSEECAIAGDFFRTRPSSTGITFNIKSVTEKSGFRTSTDSDTTVSDILHSNDLAKVFSKFKKKCECEEGEISNAFCLSEYLTVEYQEVSVLLQKIFNASLNFLCTDYHYFPITDVLLVHFHNTRPEKGMLEDIWEAHIPTEVCFRDFVYYVLDEVFDWIQDEEVKYEKKCEKEELRLQQQNLLGQANQEIAAMLAEGPIKPDLPDYLLPGSIKHKEYLKALPPPEAPKKGGSAGKKGASKKAGSAKTAKPAKGAKPAKAGAPVKLMPMQQLEPMLFPAYPLESPYANLALCTAKKGDPYHFIGYNLGSLRVQISGSTTHIFSEDNTNIRFEKSKWSTSKKKLFSLHVTKNGHSLHLHTINSSESMNNTEPKPETKSTNEPTAKQENKNEPKQEPFMFHVNCANGIILCFSKQPESVIREKRKEYDAFIVARHQAPLAKDKARSDTAYKRREQTEENIDIRNIGEKLSSNDNGLHTKSTTSSKRKLRKEKHTSSILESPNDQPEVENCMSKRMDMECRLHQSLMSNEVLEPDRVRTSAFLQTKAEILSALEKAKEDYYPCYKIYSSKIHQFKYIQRIKPNITLNIAGVIKTLTFKPPSPSKRKTSQHTHKKWDKVSDLINEPHCPMKYEFRCSWPNGLSIKTQSTSFDYDTYYVKQEYVTSKGPACDSIKEELHRCFLRNGTVLIFRTEGRLQILCSDSSIYNCQIDGFKPLKLKPNIHLMRYVKSLRRNTTTQCYSKPFRKIFSQRHIQQHLIRSDSTLGPSYSRRQYLQTMKNCFRIAAKQFGANTGLMPIPEYTVISADGSKTTVRNDRVASVVYKLLVDVALDLRNNEIFTEREDGTVSLLSGNGNFVTSFTDGTRITTGFITEDDEILIEFTAEEYASIKAAEMEANPEAAHLTGGIEEEEQNMGGFVSVVLVCKFEHPNYATVIYHYNNKCTLNMADNVCVTISRDGDYHVKLDRETDLSIDSEMLFFVQNTCSECDTRSECSINISPFTFETELFPELFLKNVDSLGNMTCIDYEGGINHIQKADSENSETDEHRLHSFYVTNAGKIEKFFIVNRNFDGYEFINDRERKLYIDRAKLKKYHSIEPNDDYITILSEMEMNYSDFWLMTHTGGKVAPASLRRKDTLPSTYFPNNWLAALPVRHFRTARRESLRMAMFNSFLINPPSVMIRRHFLQLNLTCDDRIGLVYKGVDMNELDTEQPEDTEEKTEEMRVKSAIAFRNRWNERKAEVEYYKKLLRTKEVPKYFSKKMDEILFAEKVTTNLTIDGGDLNVFCAKTQQLEYQPDLIAIAKKWAKNGYDRFQPHIKRAMETSTQTDPKFLMVDVW